MTPAEVILISLQDAGHERSDFSGVVYDILNALTAAGYVILPELEAWKVVEYGAIHPQVVEQRNQLVRSLWRHHGDTDGPDSACGDCRLLAEPWAQEVLQEMLRGSGR